MKKISLILLCTFAILHSGAQTFSNKGTDFWVGYGAHVSMFPGGDNDQDMKLYFTSDVTAKVQVSIPGNAAWGNYTVNAGTVFSTPALPKNGATDSRLFTEGISSKGIHITSDQPIVAYAHIYSDGGSGATLLFPTNTWGRDYRSLSFDQISNDVNGLSYCFVIAAEDNTTIEVVLPPGVATSTGASGTFQKTLNKGQVFNMLGKKIGKTPDGKLFVNADLTGTRIQSVSNGPNGCKPIAVYSGSSKIAIQCLKCTPEFGTQGNGSSDNLFQQVLPQTAWGTRYITIPTLGLPNNVIRVLVSDPTTVVKRNGHVLRNIGANDSLINGLYYEYYNSTYVPLKNNGQDQDFKVQTPTTVDIIESDKPVLVAQYISTRKNCGNVQLSGPKDDNSGDPEMIILSPVQQAIKSAIVYSTNDPVPGTNPDPSLHYINVSVKTGGVSSFKLDGVAPPANTFKPVPYNPAYSYAQINVAQLRHTMSCDSAFNAILYGYGGANSYGYNAGANAQNLYQKLIVKNDYATATLPTACQNVSTTLSITLPYKATQLIWDFHGNANVTPNISTDNAPKETGITYADDGRLLYIYEAKDKFSFKALGSYPLSVNVKTATPDQCNSKDSINLSVDVITGPTANFKYAFTGCGSTAQFTDLSTPLNALTPVTKWNWNFGDNTSSTDKNPLKSYSSGAGTTLPVTLTAIDTAGCISQKKQDIAIPLGPVSKFSVSKPACAGNELTFIDSSKTLTPAGVTLKFWKWDFGNNDIQIFTTADYQKELKRTYATTGNRKITLEVESSTGCKVLYEYSLDIGAQPTAKFTTPGKNLCSPVGVQFTNTSSDPTGLVLTSKWTFGDTKTSTDKDPLHDYAATGGYEVSLIVTSSAGCVSDTAKDSVYIRPVPVANFNLPGGVCIPGTTLFKNTTTIADTTLPTVTYVWNFGDGPATNTDVDGTHIYNAAPPNPPGYYAVSLTATSKFNCTGTAKIQQVKDVFAPPVAGFTATIDACLGTGTQFTDTSKGVGQVITKWYWDFGDTYTDLTKSPLHTYSATGDYFVKLAVVSDKGCISDTATETVHVNPLPEPSFILPGSCLGSGTVTFTNTSTIADGTEASFTYLWDFGDPASGTANSSTDKDGQHLYTTPGTYNITLKVTSGKNCSVTSASVPFEIAGSKPKPGFEVINENSLCSNTSTSINDTSRIDIGTIKKVEIIWDAIGDLGTVETDNSPASNGSKAYSHNYPLSATDQQYTVRLLAYSGSTCVDSIEKVITVHGSPIVSYPGHPGICLEAVARALTPATDASETTGLPGSFTYSGPGVESDGGGGYQFNPAVSGGSNLNGYPVQALYITIDGCRDSATSPMKVFPTPVANWTTGSPACEQNGVSFEDASDAGYGRIITWKWDMLGDGNIDIRGNNASFSYTYPQADTFNVALQVLTDSGCTSAITTIPLAINYLPRVAVGIPGALCLPDATGTFKDMSTIPDGTENQFKYKWDFGDGNTSQQKDPSHTYHAAGSSPYKVQLTVTSSNGCVDSLPQRIALTNMYPPPVAEFEASPSEVCQGEPMQFTDKSDGVTSPVSKWFWRFGDGGIDSVASLSHTFGRANYFDVKLTVTNGEGCSASSVRRVKVNAYPKIEMPDNVYIKPGTSTVLRPQVTGINSTNVSYAWTPGLYLDRTDVKNPVSEPPADQVYVLTVVAGTGCSSTDSIKVNLLKDLKPPNAFSPNGDGINDTWKIPNLEYYAGCEIQVFDRYGRIAYKTTGYNKPWDGTTGGKPLPTGVYYYIIDPKNGYERFTGSVTILR